MNKGDPKTRCRTMLSVGRLAILSLIISCGIDQARAQSQWTTNGNNINNTNSGNVGVGTTNPAFKLEIQGSLSRNTMALIGDGDSVGYAGLRIGALNTAGIASNRTAIFNLHMRKDAWYGGDGSGPSFIIETASKVGGFAAPFLITPTNDVILNGGAGASGMAYGKVGIGTTSPSALLHLNVGSGDVIQRFSNAGNAGGGLDLRYKFESSQHRMGITDGSGNWLFYTQFALPNTSAIAYFPGNVGIGTTTPATKLHIVSGTDNPNTLLSLDTGVHGGSQFLIGGNTNNESYFNLNVYRAGLYFTRLSVNNFGHLLLQPGGDGNVGIGTSVPNYKLDVQGGQVNASAGLCIAGDCKTAWSQVGGGSSPWSTSGSTVYYNGGNVGIGTTTAVTKLEVAPNTAIKVGNAYLSSGGDYAHLANNEWYNGSSWTATAPGALIQVAGQDVNFYRHDALGSHTHSMTINSAGNVGIGTNAPATKLHVVGDGKVTGNLTVDGNIAAKYQDVAEWVPATEPIPAGTVVVLDSTKSNHVISSTQAYDIRVAGVISEKPGIVLGESGGNKVLVATTGRVRIRVDATRGPIRIGDLLVTSDISGMAMKSEPVNLGGVQIHRPGTLIGKALEPLAKGRQGEILVLLSLQ